MQERTSYRPAAQASLAYAAGRYDVFPCRSNHPERGYSTKPSMPAKVCAPAGGVPVGLVLEA
jgi:hypothetical protein